MAAADGARSAAFPKEHRNRSTRAAVRPEGYLMITIQACTQADVPELSRLNRMLIEDEQADNLMTIPQLEQRMAGFLSADYDAFFFAAEGNRVGYALVDQTKTPPYLRHFFICRDCRRMGYGREAFFALLNHLRISEIDLDVYTWNHRGLAFWESLGFSKRCINMRFTK
jgi:ribosomal protein S18 acetylase RimI-like enzyme